MKISIEEFKKFGIEDPIIKEFEGAALSDAIISGKFDYNLLYKIDEFFKLNTLERDLYNAAIGIVNSKATRYSSFIENSERIYHSSHITNSSFVKKSTEVIGSRDIFESHKVIDSENILKGLNITHSVGIVGSEDVFDSRDIIHSQYIVRADRVIGSTNVEDSIGVSYGTNVSQSIGIVLGSELKNCIFCYGLNSKEYHIFNKPVAPEDFVEIFQELKFRLKDFMKARENALVILSQDEWNKNQVSFHYKTNLSAIFDKMSEDLYGFIGTLPNYNEDLFLQMTDKN